MNDINKNNNIKLQSVKMTTVATSVRQTPKTDFGHVLKDGMMKAGDVVTRGLQVAAPYLPPAQLISAAIAGAQDLGSSFGPSYDSRGSGGGAQYGGGSASGVMGAASTMSSSSHGFSGVGGSASGLSGVGSPAGGNGFAPGSFGSGGTMAIPGTGPTLNSNLNQPSSNFAGASNWGGTGNSRNTVDGGGATSSDAFNSMMGSTKQMAEFQASFNLQYLQLQERIQQDNRQFNLISNIMKNKNDAAKNAIGNVR